MEVKVQPVPSSPPAYPQGGATLHIHTDGMHVSDRAPGTAGAQRGRPFSPAHRGST